jgi:O6-methylguanine-DNA--protein-cysteine methyltransferase
MKNPSSASTLSFRAPGSEVEGPIRFAVGRTLPGLVLVGRRQRGICAIHLRWDAEALRDELVQAFPGIDLHQVTALVDKSTPEGVISLDIGGTAFEQKVWRALCAIPAGQTRSYGEVDQEIGMPQALRAVAGALLAQEPGR